MPTPEPERREPGDPVDGTLDPAASERPGAPDGASEAAPDGSSDDRATPDADAPGASALTDRFQQMAQGGLDGRALLDAMGGVRGIVEALLPGIAFLVLFTITGDLWLSVVVPAIIGLGLVVARAVVRQNVGPAIGGLVAIAVSGVLALRTGNGADYYVLGFYTNAAYGVGFLLSILVGWPIIGYVAGLAYGTGGRWRTIARVRRLMRLATFAWVAFFALRLAVQLPLYFAGNVEALGVTRLVMGTPMYAVLAVGTVLFARAVFRASGLTNREEQAKLS